MEAELKIFDVVTFRNVMSGTIFKAKILQHKSGKKYLLKILECDTEFYVGTEKEVDFAAKHNEGRIQLLSVQSFESDLAKYQAALYFNFCLMAVDTNDKEWFEESFAQYTLWKGKVQNV